MKIVVPTSASIWNAATVTNVIMPATNLDTGSRMDCCWIVRTTSP